MELPSGLSVGPICHLQTCLAHLAQILWAGTLGSEVPTLLAMLQHLAPCPLGSSWPSLSPEAKVL